MRLHVAKSDLKCRIRLISKCLSCLRPRVLRRSGIETATGLAYSGSNEEEFLIVKNNAEKDQPKYVPVADHWDEALLPSGYPRRHWRKLLVEIGRMGFRQLSRRWQSGQQLIQSQGVTYNVGNLLDGNEYPWPMDPIPLVIDTKEWTSIEQAV